MYTYLYIDTQDHESPQADLLMYCGCLSCSLVTATALAA